MRKISGLRRRAVLMAAMAAVLGGVPAIGLAHGHHWLSFTCIGLQVILLTLAISYLVRARRAGEPSGCDNTRPAR